MIYGVFNKKGSATPSMRSAVGSIGRIIWDFEFVTWVKVGLLKGNDIWLHFSNKVCKLFEFTFKTTSIPADNLESGVIKVVERAGRPESFVAQCLTGP